jgi:hypothetical protein
MRKVEIKSLLEAIVISTEYNGIRPSYRAYGERTDEVQKDIDEKVESMVDMYSEILREKLEICEFEDFPGYDKLMSATTSCVCNSCLSESGEESGNYTNCCPQEAGSTLSMTVEKESMVQPVLLRDLMSFIKKKDLDMTLDFNGILGFKNKTVHLPLNRYSDKNDVSQIFNKHIKDYIS